MNVWNNQYVSNEMNDDGRLTKDQPREEDNDVTPGDGGRCQESLSVSVSVRMDEWKSQEQQGLRAHHEGACCQHPHTWGN